MKKSFIILSAAIALLLFSCADEPAPVKTWTVQLDIEEGNTRTYTVVDGSTWTFPDMTEKEDRRKPMYALEETLGYQPLEESVTVTSDLKYKVLWSSLVWEISADGTLTKVYGTDRDVVFPREADGIGVTAIGSSLFKGKSIESIYIPSWIERIEDHAFESCLSLKTVTIPATVEFVGDYAFLNMTGEQTIKVASPAFLPEWDTHWKADSDAKIEFEGCTVDGNSVYRENGDGLTWFAYLDPDAEVIAIPAEVGGKKVTEIGKSAFTKNRTIKSVTLPDTIKRIGDYAFYDANEIKELTLPAGLEYIGEWAFGKMATTGITIPGTVTYVGKSAFHESTGAQVITIEKYASTALWDHEWDGGIKNVVSIADETKVGDWGLCPLGTEGWIVSKYYGTEALAELTVPEAHDGKPVIELGRKALKGSNIKKITVPGSVKKIGYMCFSSPELEELVLSEGTATLSDKAIAHCANLRKVTIPSTVTEVGNEAFRGGPADRVITIASSAQTAAWSAGWDTYLNGQLVFLDTPEDAEWSWYRVNEADGSVSAAINGTRTTDAKELVIPSEIGGLPVRHIGAGAFKGNQTIETVVLPEGIRSIGDRAFAETLKLKSINLPSSLEEISYMAFHKAGEITEITVPGSVRVIDEWAFAEMPKLAKITIGEGTEELLNASLYNNPELVEILLPSTITNLGEFAMDKCPKLAKVNVGDTRVEHIGRYCLAVTPALTELTLPGTLESIDEYAFENSAIKTLAIPESVLQVGQHAFNGWTAEQTIVLRDAKQDDGWSSNCYSGSNARFEYTEGFTTDDGLEWIKQRSYDGSMYMLLKKGPVREEPYELVIPAYVNGIPVDDIASNAFAGDTFLTKVTFPSTLSTISYNAFMNCTNLSEVVFNDGLEWIGADGFSSTALVSVTFPDSVEIIYSRAFKNCTKLESVTFGAGLKNIRPEAFSGTGIKELSFPSSLEYIGDMAFQNCAALERAVLPEVLVHIGYSAFENCTALREVNLEYASKLGYYSFKNTPSLKGHISPDNAEYIGAGSFWRSGIESATIQEGTALYSSIFRECKDLKKVTFLGRQEKIPEYMFMDCTALSDFTWPEGLKLIEGYAFKNAGNFGDIVIPRTVTTIKESAFFNQKAPKYFIPGTVKEIGYEAFQWPDCDSKPEIIIEDSREVLHWRYLWTYPFTGITIENGVVTHDGYVYLKDYDEEGEFLSLVKAPDVYPQDVVIASEVDGLPVCKIYNDTFKNKDHMTSITIPGSVKYIENNCFTYTTGLKRVTIGEGCRSIGEWTFSHSTVEEISLPASLKSLGGNCFYDCQKLKALELGPNLENVATYALQGIGKDCTVTVRQNEHYADWSPYWNSGFEGTLINENEPANP